MEKKVIRVGLIGVGGYGVNHVNGFLELQREGLVEVIALADPGVHTLQHVQESAELAAARAYLDFQDMLDKEDTLDAVVIATPIPLHYEMIRAAVERGLYVLVEKPAVPTIEQLEELIALDRDKRVVVAFQRIESSPIRTAKQLVDAGKFGELQRVTAYSMWPRTTRYYQRATWAGTMQWKGRPVLDGPLTNALSHFIHDMMYLSSGKPDTFMTPSEVLGEVYRARPIESYDLGSLTAKLVNGVEVGVTFGHCFATQYACVMEVTGTRGSLKIFDNGTQLASSEDGPIELALEDGRSRTRRRFLTYASGEAERAAVHLEDVRGYTLLTNGMFLSSGGVTTLEEGVWERQGEAEDEVYHVAKLDEFARQAATQIKTLSEIGVEWAKPGKRVTAEEIKNKPNLDLGFRI